MDTISKITGLKPVAGVKSKQVGALCSAPAQLIGLELEIEHVGTQDAAYAMIDPNVWSVVDDGSLRPQGLSWEFVSKPIEIQYAIPELATFFSKKEFGPNNYSDRTSVHVHANVLDMTPAQLATLCLVYSVVEDVLFHFVNTYNKGERESYYRDTNIYCIPWSQCRMNYEFVRQVMGDTRRAVRNWQKYTALNLLPVREQGTVEWRHMHGTNDMDKLKKWLNIIGCLMQFSKNSDFDEVNKVITTLNDTSAYHQFFTRIFGDYLPYTEEYAPSLASGVINAKFALMNRDKKKEVEFTLDEAFEDRLAEEVMDHMWDIPPGAVGVERPVDPNPVDAAGIIQQEIRMREAAVRWNFANVERANAERAPAIPAQPVRNVRVR